VRYIVLLLGPRRAQKLSTGWQLTARGKTMKKFLPLETRRLPGGVEPKPTNGGGFAELRTTFQKVGRAPNSPTRAQQNNTPEAATSCGGAHWFPAGQDCQVVQNSCPIWMVKQTVWFLVEFDLFGWPCQSRPALEFSARGRTVWGASDQCRATVAPKSVAPLHPFFLVASRKLAPLP
jgi:hypothetical protein